MIVTGNAIGFSATGSGGGIYIYNGNLTIANVVFTNNSANLGIVVFIAVMVHQRSITFSLSTTAPATAAASITTARP